ncbi:T9SS type A sorting domain-containing protein [Flavobacterium pectinovorum]|nr:T9SS type A sorting domain-containing protein [Flavobacterium pectinovorum]
MKISFVMAIVCLTISTKIFAQNPVVKIDFDQSGRQPAEVNELGYIPWIIGSGTTASKTENGVTFTITKGANGTQLATNWYKAGLSSPHFAKLVSDGVTVKDGTANQGGELELKISGLATGNHTLLAFLNAVDSPTTNTFSPIDISVNGTLIFDNVIPSVRALKTADAKSVYLNFQATAGTDVVILFAAETSGTENVKNVMLNGIELNTPNIFNQATNPIPGHNDEHVELNSGGVLLGWTPAINALSHNIYFGTDLAAVENATTASAEFKGNQLKSNASYQVNGLYTGTTYYWRVDEVLANNAIEKGNLWRFRPAQLAFPGAEGYGRFARGGRGGKVVAVTNLNDSGPGSLREAVTNEIGPRTIVFNVSGLIQLQSRLVSNNPYVTIAGQTAPGKGITLKGSSLGLGSSDNIVQNVRVRLGYAYNGDAGGMGLMGNNNIIDHCSISWTSDEGLSSRNATNITFQRSLISESLNRANHPNYPNGTSEHGFAASIGGKVGSFHHNLLAHNFGRNWSLAGGLDPNNNFAGNLDITNNVVYNWGSRTTDGGAKEVNFVGNYYKPGPGMQLHQFALTMDHENNFAGMQRAYFNGNVMPGYFDVTNQESGRRSRLSNGITINYETFVTTPFFPSYVTTQSAENAYKIVLSDVGCTQPQLDNHDIRMINETLAGTYSVTGNRSGKKGFPDHESDAGGYETYPEITRDANWDTDQDGLPNWWETIHGTNVNSGTGDFSDSNSDTDLDGYTNLDLYLQWMSLPHYDSPDGNKININIQNLSKGFTTGVNYSLSNVVNGNASLNSDIVEFTPTATGLCSFDFTVTDNEGASMTRKVNIVSGYSATLSVEKSIKENTSFSVWPVPNNGSFSVLMENDGSNAELKIFDILGKEVLKRNITGKIQENISLKSKGVFILKFSDSKTKEILHIKKIIVH